MGSANNVQQNLFKLGKIELAPYWREYAVKCCAYLPNTVFTNTSSDNYWGAECDVTNGDFFIQFGHLKSHGRQSCI